MRSSLLLALLLAVPALAGCFSNAPVSTADVGGLPTFDTSRGWSMPLSPALYEILPSIERLVPSFDNTPISVAIFFPGIEGCDWEASELPDRCRVPVVMDAGPYYAGVIDRVKYRPPIIEWLVPRGYAVAHMSVRGTGESGGCMEFMSVNEQKDVDHIVTMLGEAPWSNGNVGMMGRSYDGTTPFMVAAMGNPYLKTIVPISGVASVPDLMFKNGTSEFRGPIMHNYVYWVNYGLGAADGGTNSHRRDHLTEQACAETGVATLEGAQAAATGQPTSEYWKVRDFRGRIVENYKGSLWIVHGREDWNVNPSQVVPWINELQDAGLEVKAWLGVWGHAYPDRVDEHRNVRWDWAEQTVQWFDHYLKGTADKPRLEIEVEDTLFVWRAEASYPPRDATMRPFELGSSAALVETGASPGSATIHGAHGAACFAELPGCGFSRAAFTSEPLAASMRVAGLPQLHVTVTPTTAAGGYLFAEMYDVFPDGRAMRVGWAAIDLRHHAGGYASPATLVPGQAVVAKMEFEPLDHLFAQGHRLRVVLHKDGVEDILPSPSPEANTITLGNGASVLHLPEIQRPNLLPSYVPPRVD